MLEEIFRGFYDKWVNNSSGKFIYVLFTLVSSCSIISFDSREVTDVESGNFGKCRGGSSFYWRVVRFFGEGSARFPGEWHVLVRGESRWQNRVNHHWKLWKLRFHIEINSWRGCRGSREGDLKLRGRPAGENGNNFRWRLNQTKCQYDILLEISISIDCKWLYKR
jgi:hypothetical protein